MQSVSSFYEKLTFPNKIPVFPIHTNGHFLDIKTWISEKNLYVYIGFILDVQLDSE